MSYSNKGRITPWAALVVLALCIAGVLLLNKTTKPAYYQVWGYYPSWLKDDWRKIDLGLYDQILFFDIPVGTDSPMIRSNGFPENWQPLIAAAKKRGARLQPTFTLFDAGTFENIFSNQNLRKSLQADMLALLEQTDATGMQLDFEIFGPVSKTSTSGYRAFLKTIKDALAARNKKLSIFVLTEDSAGLYDEEALKQPDYIVIQGYDAHWKGSANSGSVAQLRGTTADSWNTSLNHYLSLGVSRNKILMSVPYFGYEWPTLNDTPGSLTRGTGQEISFAPLASAPEVKASALARIKQYGMRRDPQTGSPYYAYQDETGWHQGWFEDEESLSAKFA
ncbi:MAG: glycosyl hydrolase family 18 protein, partial [Proteobacteria bacterium]|nr:glycosyl hydrolase family 18 protein [Pseudomonadota bacterium]